MQNAKMNCIKKSNHENWMKLKKIIDIKRFVSPAA